MALPASVIKKDHDLEADYEAVGMQLMELRWHWTLDTSNPKRVSIREYAREVSRGFTPIRNDVQGWADKIADDAAMSDLRTGIAKTPNDYRKKASLSAEKQHAAEAIAKSTGKSVGRVVDAHREEINAVVGEAKVRAEETGTTVEEQIDKAVEWDLKARKGRERAEQLHKENHTARYLEVEADLGVAMQRLRKVLNSAKDVGFTDLEVEVISESLAKLRALMNLIDLRIAGETNIDWDHEFQKITEG